MSGVRLRSVFGGFVTLVLAAGALCLAAGTILGIANFRDVGYPDSADVRSVGALVRSGRLYPDFNRPPYLVTLYGPLTYFVLAAPYVLAQAIRVDPQIPMRLAEVGALLACLWLVHRIAQRLYRSSRIVWTSVLFAASSAALASWITQIRGDLPAVAVSLLAVHLGLRLRLRTIRRSSQVLVAGLCAGLAIVIKQTFWAAPIAMIAWLIYLRRFKDAAVCAAASVVTIVSIYGFTLWREPLGWKHLAAMTHPSLDYRGAVTLLSQAASQPAAPFALLGAALALRRTTAQRTLLLFYCVAAWLIAIFTVAQVGANINYFWEPLLSSSIFAGAGLCELMRRPLRIPPVGFAVLAILLCWLLVPTLLHDYYDLRRSFHQARAYRAGKAEWQSFAAAVSGQRLLSTFPDVAVLSSTVEMPDPFMNTLLERRGAWDSEPVTDAIARGAYVLIVMGRGEVDAPRSFRGVPLWSPKIWSAVKQAYKPACMFDGMEIWQSAQSVNELDGLRTIGCVPLSLAGN